MNADGKGKPGVIDLIDVSLNLGTLGAGGPVLSTNFGGNVRYIHVPRGQIAYRPRIFGGSQPEETVYVVGQSAQLTDDSGAQVEITPTLQRLINPLTGLINEFSGQLTVLTYPIARSLSNTGGGGVVIIRAESTRGMKVTTSGGTAEIGEIRSTGSGPGLVVNPNQPNGPDQNPNTGDEVSFWIR